MTIETLEKAKEIVLEIKNLEKHLEDWNRSRGISNIELYDANRSSTFYINVNMFVDIVGFEKLKYIMIESLDAKISKLQKEFDEL